MNARQKAKKYKRKYEDLLNQPVRFNVVTPKIDTLRIEKFYSKEYLDALGADFLLERMKETIAAELANSIDKYVKFAIDYGPDGNLLTCDIQVVNIRESAKGITNVTEEEPWL